MFSISQLSEDQKQQLHQWAQEGLQLNDLQKKMKEEFQMNITYMDTRFMATDLALEIKNLEEKPKKEAEPVPEETPESAPPAAEKGSYTEDDLELLPPKISNVTVTIDEIVRPGALVSGKVVFSDGVKASWNLDEMGRLGLDAGDPNYQPSPEDIDAFQQELRQLMTR